MKLCERRGPYVSRGERVSGWGLALGARGRRPRRSSGRVARVQGCVGPWRLLCGQTSREESGCRFEGRIRWTGPERRLFGLEAMGYQARQPITVPA